MVDIWQKYVLKVVVDIIIRIVFCKINFILSVNLMNCIGVKDEFLQYIFVYCLNLRNFYLNGCNLIIDYGIFVLVCNCGVFEMVLIFLRNIFE